MRKFLYLAAGLILMCNLDAQPPRIPLYSINQIPLPAEMDKQVCISGMVCEAGKLYFASERCPIIKVGDPENGSIIKTIDIQVPQEFEMEGMTNYEGKLYLISEHVAAVYEVDIATGVLRIIRTSNFLPEKSKSGDGMEGIAANSKNKKFYLLRERNENMTQSQLMTYSVQEATATEPLSLKYESTIELPLENPQWRYSDICYDSANQRLLCLKSYSKGRMRKQFIEAIEITADGSLLKETVKDVPVENFSTISNQYKEQDYSMNLEGITVDAKGNIYVISDNTSGKAQCEAIARERTILLELKKNN